jgi:hypothetical protein
MRCANCHSIIKDFKVDNSGDTSKAKTQKAILCELTDMSLKRNNFFDCKSLERFSECSCADCNMVKKLYSIFSNILLNNYVKNKNVALLIEQNTKCKKRKIETYSKYSIFQTKNYKPSRRRGL